MPGEGVIPVPLTKKLLAASTAATAAFVAADRMFWPELAGSKEKEGRLSEPVPVSPLPVNAGDTI